MAARGKLFVAFAVLGGALLPFVRQAEAASDKYIVLLDIEGERSPRLKKTISRMVKEQYKVMEGASYKDAARRLRAEKLTPSNVKKVCGYLEVDGIIDGTLVKEDGRYKFTLRLRSAVTGAIAKKIPMFINQPSLSQNMSDQLEERLLAAIADLPRAGGGTKIAKGKKSKFSDEEADEEEDEEEEPRKMTKAEKRAAEKKAKAAALAEKKAEEKAAREEAAREKKEREKAEKEMAKKKKKKGKSADDEEAEDEEDEEAALASKKGKKDKKKVASRDEDEEEAADEPVDEDSEDADEEEDEPKRAAMRDAGGDDEGDDASNPDLGLSASAQKADRATGVRTTPLLVNAGVSFVGRNLTFNSSAPAEQQPQGYKGKTVPGVYATGELYPAGFAGAKGVLANVGVGFVADRVIKLNSSVSDGMDGTALLTTKQSRYGANLRYRHNFGSGPKGVSVWGSVGYNKLTFSIDKAAAPENVIVDVPNTSYAYVDPGVGVRVPVAGTLSALAEGKFMAVLDTGEVQQPEQYGAATVTGFDADLALEYGLGDHFLVRGGARIINIGYKFKGNGELSDRDANGSADVGGASDRYLGGYLTAGYAF